MKHSLLRSVREIAVAAGNTILQHYVAGVTAQSKADGSPITAADRAAHELILTRLPALLPGIQVISEEAFDAQAPLPTGAFWLVDPLDGTKEFLQRNGEFTVNIALIENGEPVLGVVHVPVQDDTYAGEVRSASASGRAAWRWLGQGADGRSIRTRALPPQGLTVLASRSHNDALALQKYLAGRKVANTVSAGSSLKFCVVARGDADLYPRFGSTMEWDTAAGHAVLVAAGGQVATLDDQALRYGKPGLRNPHFIASASKLT